VRITKIDGTDVEFHIRTHLSSSSTTSTVKPDVAAQTVVDFVSSHTAFNATDVQCPSGVKAQVGVEFDCHFTGPDGPYTANMRVKKVNGDDVEFDVLRTHLSSGTPTFKADPADKAGPLTLEPNRTANSIADTVFSHTGFRPTDVQCPSGVKAEVGVKFDCHFTGSDGAYTANVRITSVNGSDVQYVMDTHLS